MLVLKIFFNKKFQINKLKEAVRTGIPVTLRFSFSMFGTDPNQFRNYKQVSSQIR